MADSRGGVKKAELWNQLRSWGRRWRAVWAPALLLVVGWRAAVAHGDFAPDDVQAYYATAAQVIVTLYVAMAVELAKTDSVPTIEHWIFLLVSCLGLLAALRGLLDGGVLVFSLSVAGAVAALAVVIDAFINRHGGERGWLWTGLFLAALAMLVLET